MSVTPYASGPSFTVEIGIASAASGTGTWNGTLWDTATWGPDVSWTDISAYVRYVSTFRGRSREDDRYQAGTMTITLDNRTARFTPGNLSGPYVVSGVSQLRPRVPIRVRATYLTIAYNIFYGYVTNWQDDFPGSGRDATATVTAVDPLSILTAFNGAAVVALGAGDSAGARITRILNNAGWTLASTLDTGLSTMQATTLAANAFTEIALTADSEGGAVWCEPDGTIIFEDRNSLVENTRSTTSQVSFANTGGAAVGYQNPVVAYDDTSLYNIVRYARVGSTEITGTDLNSRALYGDRVFSRDDLVCQTDAQVTALVATDLERFRNPEYRVVQLDVKPRANQTVYWPHALGRRLRDRGQVIATIPVSAFTLTKNVFIDGIAHSGTPDDWTTTFYFASATPYDTYSSSLFDSGLFDTALFFT